MRSWRVIVAASDNADDELKRVQAFYKAHQNNWVREREPQVLLGTIQDEKMYMVEDVGSGELLAVSACFDYLDGEYRESGGTLVGETGFGLQVLLNQVAALSEFNYDRPHQAYFSIVGTGNVESMHNLTAKVGFVEWLPPLQLLSVRTPAQPVVPNDKRYLQLKDDALNNLANDLCDTVSRASIYSKSKKETVSVEIDVPIVTTGTLAAICAGYI